MLVSGELCTWAGRSRFKYHGSVSKGTTILYGRNFHWSVTVTSAQYEKMLNQLSGHEIPCGTIREVEKRSRGSLGQWLADNVTRVSIASYVAPILLHEGYCVRAGANIRFLPHGGFAETQNDLFETKESLEKYQSFLDGKHEIIDNYFSRYKQKIVDAWRNYQWPLGMSRDISLSHRNELEAAMQKDLSEHHGAISKSVFTDVEVWGFGQSKIKDITSMVIEDTTRKAFELLRQGKLREAARTLRSLKGVGISRASKLLALSNQNIYGIYDSRSALALKDIQYNKVPIIPIPPGQQRPSISSGDFNVGFEHYQWVLRYMLPKFRKEFTESIHWRVADIEIGLWVVGRSLSC